MATQTKSKKTPNKAAKAQSAVEMLKDDHDKVSGLLEKLEKAKTGSKRSKLLEQIHGELAIHVKIRSGSLRLWGRRKSRATRWTCTGWVPRWSPVPARPPR